MNKLELLLNKPYYIFRPEQLFRRLFQLIQKPYETETVVLPWGLKIRCHPGEMIGSSLKRTGVFDLAVTETLYRLLDVGEVGVDVGANIGYMTSILAFRSGKGGRIYSFEPHPEIFKELTENVSVWAEVPTLAPIVLHEAALSRKAGRGRLGATKHFHENRGTASLADINSHVDDQEIYYDVLLEQLDVFLSKVERIGVLKIDVEGHEMGVLEGATGLLSTRRIRDIIFEEHDLYPTPVTHHLEALGFTLFHLRQSLFGPCVISTAEKTIPHSWDAASYLATLDPVRALSRLQKKGWFVLGAGKRRHL